MKKNSKTKKTIYISTNLYNKAQLKLADLIEKNQTLDNITLSWLIEKLLYKFLKIPAEKFLMNGNDLTDIIQNENEKLYKIINKNNCETNKNINELKYILIHYIKEQCIEYDNLIYFDELIKDARNNAFRDYNILNEKFKDEDYYKKYTEWTFTFKKKQNMW